MGNRDGEFAKAASWRKVRQDQGLTFERRGMER